MKNNINIQTNLITNFKPFLLNDFNNYVRIKKSKQKYCKNFFIYLLLFKYKNTFFKKSNIFIKKYKKKVYTILRSPYRHKLARHQIFLKRYRIKFSIFIQCNKPIFINKFKKINNFLVFLTKFNKIFESNLIYTNNIGISFPINYSTNFNIKYFKNKNK